VWKGFAEFGFFATFCAAGAQRLFWEKWFEVDLNIILRRWMIGKSFFREMNPVKCH
jgi:hypothetical protein